MTSHNNEPNTSWDWNALAANSIVSFDDRTNLSKYIEDGYKKCPPCNNVEKFLQSIEDNTIDEITKWSTLDYISSYLGENETILIDTCISIYENSKNILLPTEYFSLGCLWIKKNCLLTNKKVFDNFSQIVDICDDPIVHYHMVKYSLNKPFQESDLNKLREHIELAKVDEKYNSKVPLDLCQADIYCNDLTHFDFKKRLAEGISIYEKYLNSGKKKYLNRVNTGLAKALFTDEKYDKAYNLKEYLTWELSYYELDISKALQICNKYTSCTSYSYINQFASIIKKAYSLNATEKLHLDFHCRELAKTCHREKYNLIAIELFSLIPDYLEVAKIYYKQNNKELVLEYIDKAIQNNDLRAWRFKIEKMNERFFEFKQEQVLNVLKAFKEAIIDLLDNRDFESLNTLLELYSNSNDIYNFVGEEYHNVLLNVYEKLNENRNKVFFYTCYLIGKYHYKNEHLDSALEFLTQSSDKGRFKWIDLGKMIRECKGKEFFASKIQSIIDVESENMSNGSYLAICNLLKELYEKEKKWDEDDEDYEDY